jgi:hypothetical protein
LQKHKRGLLRRLHEQADTDFGGFANQTGEQAMTGGTRVRISPALEN